MTALETLYEENISRCTYPSDWEISDNVGVEIVIFHQREDVCIRSQPTKISGIEIHGKNGKLFDISFDRDQMHYHLKSLSADQVISIIENHLE